MRTTNCPHWPPSDGTALGAIFGIKYFEFLNDFAVAGLGTTTLKFDEFVRRNRAEVVPSALKVVMGPGTGLGMGLLFKSEWSPCYEVFPCEGGHTDFSVRGEEDHKLLHFARDYIENSENIENRRGKGKIDRVSIERLCAGPAVPLIYEFYKKEHPDLKRILEEGDDAKHPDEINSSDIISKALDTDDELLMMVVNKFAQILGVEIGNFALKTLPYGGMFLVGGVVKGLMDFLEHDKKFLETIYDKGRLTSTIRRIPLFIVKPHIELGLRGAEEHAFRLMKCWPLPEADLQEYFQQQEALNTSRRRSSILGN